MSTPTPQHASPTGKKIGAIVDWLAHGGKPKAAKKTVVISMMAFAIMNVTTIVSLRGMPAQAEYGLTSIFYYVFAAVVFLIPVSLVAAELASAYPNRAACSAGSARRSDRNGALRPCITSGKPSSSGFRQC